MSESNVFVLPENWNDPDLVDEGEYRVTVTKLASISARRPASSLT